MKAYAFTTRELEEVTDRVKVVMLADLVSEGLLDMEKADEWAETHTVIFRPKTIFRTLSKKWEKSYTEEGSNACLVVSIKKVQDSKDS